MQYAERHSCLVAILKEKLNKLKVNREKVGEEVLKTTYKDAYNRLLKEINVLSGYLFYTQFVYVSFKKDYLSTVNECKKKFLKTIEENYDIDAAIELTSEFILESMCLQKAVLRFEYSTDEKKYLDTVDRYLQKTA